MEFGSAQQINTPYGTVYLNTDGAGLGLPASCCFFLRAVEGQWMAAVRNPVNDRSARSGGLLHKFHKGAKYIEFDCLIIANTPAHRTTMRDHLLGCLNSILTADGTYYFYVPGTGYRHNTVRLFEPVEVRDPEGGKAGPKHATWQLIAYGVSGEDGFEDMEV